MKVCFIGHKTIKESEKIKNLLTKTTLEFIKKGLQPFYLEAKVLLIIWRGKLLANLKKNFLILKEYTLGLPFNILISFMKNIYLNIMKKRISPKK